jgi:hypothetical protein
MTKKPHRLSQATTIAHVDKMVELIQKDVIIGIAVEAALVTANDTISGELRTVRFYGADCYNSVKQCMALFLALTLAKLFEIPTPRKSETPFTRYNRSDVASIPLMVRLLKQKRCQKVLSGRARGWTPTLNGMENENAAACEREIDSAVAAYTQLRITHAGRNAIAKLKSFRDKVLAHTLLGQALEKTPSYNELFLLMDVARNVTGHAKLAILGDNLDLKDFEEEVVRMSKAFWRPALTAAARPKSVKLGR